MLLLAALPAAAQDDQRAAEERLRELKSQIADYEQRLSRTQREETSAAAALSELDREIAVREALIDSYREQQAVLSGEAVDIQRSMASLETELQTLKAEYAVHARNAYMRGRVGDLALILSAGSINQMLVRARYLQRFSRQRQGKLGQIAATRQAMASRQAALDSSAARIDTLLAESRAEQQALASRKSERAVLVEDLRQQRAGLQAELQQRQNDANRLEARIQQLIAAEEARRREAERTRRAEAERARAEGDTEAVRAAEAAESAFVELTGSFRQNRGRLPWPATGVVTGTFGTRTHPVYGTKTKSIGLEISSAPMASVRAVFDGLVSRVFAMPGYGTCIMVSHGDYATIYGNLSSVDVRQGQEVRAGEGVGRAGTAEDPLGAGVFFALFSGGEAVDPAGWLARR
ncbi:MAG: peptidoglycan DD-metalloendopeptidase family protein [Bacteroidota bacterium]